jgi:hypothetical protein
LVNLAEKQKAGNQIGHFHSVADTKNINYQQEAGKPYSPKTQSIPERNAFYWQIKASTMTLKLPELK